MLKWLRGIRREAGYAHVTIDHDGRVTNWDEGATRIFGWTYTEVLGKLLSETLVPPPFRRGHEMGLGRLRAEDPDGGRLLGKELHTVAMHRDGHQLTVRMIINRLTGHNGHAYYVASLALASTEFMVLGPEGAVASPAAAEKERFRQRNEELMELLADATAEVLIRRPPSGA